MFLYGFTEAISLLQSTASVNRISYESHSGALRCNIIHGPARYLTPSRTVEGSVEPATRSIRQADRKRGTRRSRSRVRHHKNRSLVRTRFEGPANQGGHLQ